MTHSMPRLVTTARLRQRWAEMMFQHSRIYDRSEKSLGNSSPISQCKYYSQLVLSSLLIYIYANNSLLECSMSPVRAANGDSDLRRWESGGCVLQPAEVMNEFQEPTFYWLSSKRVALWGSYKVNCCLIRNTFSYYSWPVALIDQELNIYFPRLIVWSVARV